MLLTFCLALTCQVPNFDTHASFLEMVIVSESVFDPKPKVNSTVLLGAHAMIVHLEKMPHSQRNECQFRAILITRSITELHPEYEIVEDCLRLRDFPMAVAASALCAWELQLERSAIIKVPCSHLKRGVDHCKRLLGKCNPYGEYYGTIKNRIERFSIEVDLKASIERWVDR